MNSSDPYWKAALATNQNYLHPPPLSFKPINISRVAQLDADLLDTELEHVLTEPLYASLQLFKSSRNTLDLQASLSALIRYGLLRTSLLKYGASYGAALQNLWFTAAGHRPTAASARQPMTRRQLEAYALLSVLPRYAIDRMRDFMLSRGWSDYPSSSNRLGLLVPDMLRESSQRDINKRRRERKRLAWEALSAAEQAWTIMSLANFISFLAHGKYRSLLDRILDIRLIYRHQSFSRAVSFEFLNRQLVWEAFTEFLLFLLPLVNLRKLRIKAGRWLSTTSLLQWPLYQLRKALVSEDAAKKAAKRATDPGQDEESTGQFSHLAGNICPICYSFSEMPGAHIAEPGDPTDPTMGVMVGFSSVTNASGRNAATEVKIPYAVDCCGGLYCYYCIAAKLVTWDEDRAGLDGGWRCLRCGNEAFEARRAVTDELEVASKEQDLLVA